MKTSQIQDNGFRKCLATGFNSELKLLQSTASHVLKARLSPSKKLFYLLQEKPFKNDEKMKNVFCFILKALFVLQIFKFLFWIFGDVEKTAWLEIRSISKLMTSQSG